MRDILPDVERWRERGERVAVATVVTMYGSAPRRPGAKLAVSESGELAGSVSGGCVEPAVVHAAMEVIENGKPQMLEFGITEEENVSRSALPAVAQSMSLSSGWTGNNNIARRDRIYR